MKIGTLRETAHYLLDPVGWFDENVRRRGPVFVAETIPYGEEIFVADPEVARAVLSSASMLGGRANVALRHIVGEQSVSCLDGAEHALRRRQLAPALALARKAAGADSARGRTLRQLASVPPGEVVRLDRLVRPIVMSSMLEGMFGASNTELGALGAAFSRMVDLGSVPFAQLGVLPALRRDFPGSPYRAFLRAADRVDTELRARVGDARGGVVPALRSIRDGRDRALSDDALRDEVFTLLGAGYETTATSICWALEAILLDEAVARAIANGDGPLLEASIRESLRLRPTLPTVRRIAAEAARVGDRIVAAGTSVVLAIHSLHRAALEHPERFDPKRPDRDRSFFAFGGGARTCPGMSVALDHMQGVLCALVPAISLVEPRPSRPAFRGATLAPSRSILVRRLPR